MNQWSKRLEQLKIAFLHLKIQQRLLLSYAVVVVVPLLLLTICINWVLSDSLSEKSLQRMDQETEIISKNIEMFVSEIQSYGKLLSVNQSLQWILTHPTQRTTAERFLAERKVRQESGYYSVVINRAVRYELYDASANRVLKREEESFEEDAIAEIINEKKRSIATGSLPQKRRNPRRICMFARFAA